MSTDESVTRPLPVTPVSSTTWQITKHYKEPSLSNSLVMAGVYLYNLHIPEI